MLGIFGHNNNMAILPSMDKIKRQVAILPSMDKILRGYMFFMFYNDFSQYVSLFENKLSLKVTSTTKLFFAVK